MNQELGHTEYQQIAQQLLRVSKSLNQLYQDQLAILGDVTAQNMFRIHQAEHEVSIANGLFTLNFSAAKHSDTQANSSLFHIHFVHPSKRAEAIEEFLLHELQFQTGDLKPLHSLYLRNKAQQLRELLLAQTYTWVNGYERVRHFFQNISLVQAEIVDHLMIRARQYRQPLMLKHVQAGQEIPEVLLEQWCDMFRLDRLCVEPILPLQNLIESLHDFSFSAAQFLPRPMFRICQLIFEDRFSLHELCNHQDDIQLLYKHAEQQPHLLGFSRLMNREYWSQNDSLAKQNFLLVKDAMWQKKVAKLPIFDSARAVNWLFKQHVDVLDWVSQNIQHSSVRVAVTALSYLDCSQIHPQVILATLQYFQFASARMFIHSCYFQAMQDQWFTHPNNQRVELKDAHDIQDEQRVSISPSVLYLDEWMGLMHDVVGCNDVAVKKVYSRLSRIMQAYMLHLDKMTEHLSADVMAYVRTETHQDRDFFTILHRHQIQLHEFRQCFNLQAGHVRESVFDSYVRDYLGDYFAQNKAVPKNTTWMGLFLQAVDWHADVQKQEILSKLKKQYQNARWQAITPEQSYQFEGWQFEEMKNLDRIIAESKVLHHCLAASYAQRVIEGEYVAFHMSQHEEQQHLTLGCHLRDGQLLFDQLEYANNQKAGVVEIHHAVNFIQWLNPQLERKD
jgi:hypothetical protein